MRALPRGSHDPGRQVPATAIGVQGGDDQEQDEQVDVAVRQVADHRPQAEQDRQRPRPRWEGKLGRLDDAENGRVRQERQRHLDVEPRQRAGEGRAARLRDRVRHHGGPVDARPRLGGGERGQPGTREAQEDDRTEGEGRRGKIDFPRVDKRLAMDLVEAMRPMADGRGVAVSAIALAWLLHQDVVSSVIVGARRPGQLAENLAASDVELSADELTRLGALGVPEPEYPGWAIASQESRHGFRVSPRRTAA